MTLVHTARLTTALQLPGILDVTRKTGREGLPFAPSWRLLAPYLDKRRRNGGALRPFDWAAYRAAYLEEMRASWAANRRAWDALLARPAVVLGCYCADPRQCHRSLLAEEVLLRLGAVYDGELAGEEVPSPREEEEPFSLRFYEALHELPDREEERARAAGVEPRRPTSYVPLPREQAALSAAVKVLSAAVFSPGGAEPGPRCDWCSGGYPARPGVLCEECRADFVAEWEERAAIAEYLGGLSREAAEAIANGGAR